MAEEAKRMSKRGSKVLQRLSLRLSSGGTGDDNAAELETGSDDVDTELEERVLALMWDAAVLGVGGDVYGLKWRFGSADEPRIVKGGWLFQTSKEVTGKKKHKTKLSFFVLDDVMQELRQCKDETGSHSLRKLAYDEIVGAKAHFSSSADATFVRVSPKRGSDWFMMPVQGNDKEVVCRWAAALRHRVPLFDEQTQRGRESTLRIAVWMQSVVRMRAAIEKAERRKQRRAGLLNRIGGAVLGFNDTDSEGSDDDDDDDRVDEFTDAGAGAGAGAGRPRRSPFLATFVSALVADMYDSSFSFPGAGEGAGEGAGDGKGKGKGKDKGAGGKNGGGAPPRPKRRSRYKPRAAGAAHRRESVDRRDSGERGGGGAGGDSEEDSEEARGSTAEGLRRNSSFIQDLFAPPPLEQYEVEEELFENERWGIPNGWAKKALLPTDRAPFTDRIGRGDYASLADCTVPAGWAVTTDWSLDVSGQVNGRCGTDGWVYAIDFPPLDSALARGAPKVTKGIRMVVRRRRWVRRRRPERQSRIETPVVWHGWLGRRSTGTGRWQSRYFVLTQGLKLHGRITGLALSFFRTEFANHLDMVGSSDLEAWNLLSSKQLRTWTLDGANVLHHGEGRAGRGRGGRGGHGRGGKGKGKGKDKDMDNDKAMAKAKKKRTKNHNPCAFELRLATQFLPVKLMADSPEQRENWVGALDFTLRDQTKRFTLTKSLELPNSADFLNLPQYENMILDRLLPMRVDEAFDLLFHDKTFEANLFKSAKFELVDDEKWTQRKDKGSRRKLIFDTHRKKLYGGKEVVQKFKVVRSDPGSGYQVDSSIQVPESAYGNIYQDEVRVVLSDWKNKMTRAFVTHRVEINTQDEAVRTFVESNARAQILAYYVEDWLPFVQKRLKQMRDDETKQQTTQLQLSSPSGIPYKVDRKASAIRPVDPSYHY